jgi:hypothetical protein
MTKKIQLTYDEMYPIFKRVLSRSDLDQISKLTNYATPTVRLVLHGHQPVTNRNKVIIDEAVKVTNAYLQESLKILGNGKV